MAMGKRFRTDHLDQGLLLPPSLHDWLPEGHLARFIADVIEELDLGLIYRSYEGDGRGLAAYQPAMMVRLLLYGYCLGVVSSRKMERATHEDVAFRSEEHTSELQSLRHLVCRLLLEKKTTVV